MDQIPFKEIPRSTNLKSILLLWLEDSVLVFIFSVIASLTINRTPVSGIKHFIISGQLPIFLFFSAIGGVVGVLAKQYYSKRINSKSGFKSKSS